MDGERNVLNQGEIREQIHPKPIEPQVQHEQPNEVDLDFWRLRMRGRGQAATILALGAVAGGGYVLHKTLGNPDVVKAIGEVFQSVASRAITTSITRGSLYVKVLTCGKEAREKLLDTYFKGNLLQEYKETVEKVFKEKMEEVFDEITLVEVGVIRANESDFDDIVQEARDTQESFTGLNERNEIIFSNHPILKDDSRVLKQEISEDDSKDTILGMINHLKEKLDQISKPAFQVLHHAEIDELVTGIADLKLSKQNLAKQNEDSIIPPASNLQPVKATTYQKPITDDMPSTSNAPPIQHEQKGSIEINKFIGDDHIRKLRTFSDTFVGSSDAPQLLNLWVDLHKFEDSSLLKQAAGFFPTGLDLSQINLDEDQISSIFHVLKYTNKFIEELRMIQCQLSSSAFCQISKGLLQSGSCIRVLNINFNQLDDISSILEVVPKISDELYLWESFTDIGKKPRDANQDERKKIQDTIEESNRSLKVWIEETVYIQSQNGEITRKVDKNSPDAKTDLTETKMTESLSSSKQIQTGPKEEKEDRPFQSESSSHLLAATTYQKPITDDMPSTSNAPPIQHERKGDVSPRYWQPPMNIDFAYKTSCIIDDKEKIINVCDCSITFPQGALRSSRHFDFSLYYGKENVKTSAFLVLTPTLECSSSLQKLERPVTIKLSSSYVPLDPNIIVVPQSSVDGKNWTNLRAIKHGGNKFIAFDTTTFSWKRVIAYIWKNAFSKRLSYLCSRNPNPSKYPFLVWSFRDDVMNEHDSLQAGEGFKGTLIIRWKEDLNLKLSSPNSIVEPVDKDLANEVLYEQGIQHSKQFRIKPLNPEITFEDDIFAYQIRSLLSGGVIRDDIFPLPSFSTNTDISNLIDKGYIMISYNWSDSKEIARKIKDRLSAKGYPMWIDNEQMRGNIYERMAEAVENASLILIFLSPNYEASGNCVSEASMARDLKKRIIPIRVQASYGPKKICSFVGAGLLYFDFSEESLFDEKLKELIDAIGPPSQYAQNV